MVLVGWLVALLSDHLSGVGVFTNYETHLAAHDALDVAAAHNGTEGKEPALHERGGRCVCAVGREIRDQDNERRKK